jgi:hypothetical protein
MTLCFLGPEAKPGMLGTVLPAPLSAGASLMTARRPGVQPCLAA